MPPASCALPRQMFPPPTTTATETPSRATAAISSAITAVVAKSTALSLPPKASPESFRRTRLKDGRALRFTDGELHKAPDLDVLAEHPDGRSDQLADGLIFVHDEGLIDQNMIAVPFVQLTLDDARLDFGRLPGRDFLR